MNSSQLRRFAAPIAAAALLLGAARPASAQSVTIAPVPAAQTDTVTVAGDGLMPGLALDINFVSPAGTVFSTALLNQVVVVDSDGTFSFSFLPTEQFQGESFGDWTTQVCASGTNDCVQTTFALTP